MFKKLIILILIFFLLLIILFTDSNEKEGKYPQKFLPPQNKNFDVIVVGAEPEGIAAAVSAARNGLNVLLVEDNDGVGGLMTFGKLCFIDMNYDNNGKLLTRGIFQEFYDAVGGNVFDVEKARRVFEKMLADENISVKLDTSTLYPIMNGNTIMGIAVTENGKKENYYARRIIDATADADLAAAAGVPYTIGGEDRGEKDSIMGVTLIFELKDVNWLKIFLKLNWNRLWGYIQDDGRKKMGATLDAAWGFGEKSFDYQPRDPAMRLRGLNIARQQNGNVLVNALIIFGVDVLDNSSKKLAIMRAKKELLYIIPYLRKHLPGFENAKLAGTAKELYVRESRHILGEYQLTIDDVLENRDHWDRIAIGGYPVDIQPTSPLSRGIVIGDPDKYSIPFRCLVPLKIDGLLVIGRSASYTSLAAGSARVIPVGMCEGEAAGVAAAYSIENDISFRDMARNKKAIKSIQKRLTEQGAYLKPFNIETPLTSHWAYEGIKKLRRLGLVAGGYSNDYQLEERMEGLRFQNLINNIVMKVHRGKHDYIYAPQDPTCGDILQCTTLVFGKKTKSPEEAYKLLQDKNIITEQLKPFFSDYDKQPQAAEVLVLIANLHDYLTEKAGSIY